MSFNLHDNVGQTFDQDLIEELARQIDEPSENTLLATEAAAPALLEAMLRHSDTLDGAEGVFRIVSTFDATIADSFGQLMRERTSLAALGQTLVGALFGDLESAFREIVANYAQVNPESAGHVMRVVTTLCIAMLKEQRITKKLNRDDLTRAIESQLQFATLQIPAELAERLTLCTAASSYESEEKASITNTPAADTTTMYQPDVLMEAGVVQQDPVPFTSTPTFNDMVSPQPYAYEDHEFVSPEFAGFTETPGNNGVMPQTEMYEESEFVAAEPAQYYPTPVQATPVQVQVAPSQSAMPSTQPEFAIPEPTPTPEPEQEQENTIDSAYAHVPPTVSEPETAPEPQPYEVAVDQPEPIVPDAATASPMPPNEDTINATMAVPSAESTMPNGQPSTTLSSTPPIIDSVDLEPNPDGTPGPFAIDTNKELKPNEPESDEDFHEYVSRVNAYTTIGSQDGDSDEDVRAIEEYEAIAASTGGKFDLLKSVLLPLLIVSSIWYYSYCTLGRGRDSQIPTVQASTQEVPVQPVANIDIDVSALAGGLDDNQTNSDQNTILASVVEIEETRPVTIPDSKLVNVASAAGSADSTQSAKAAPATVAPITRTLNVTSTTAASNARLPEGNGNTPDGDTSQFVTTTVSTKPRISAIESESAKDEVPSDYILAGQYKIPIFATPRKSGRSIYSHVSPGPEQQR